MNDQSKDGQKFLTKNGKKFWKIAVQCEEYKERYLSSLIFDEDDIMMTWKAGYTVAVIVEERGQYLNFEMPDKIDYLEERILALEERLNTPQNPTTSANELPIDDGIKVEEIPF